MEHDYDATELYIDHTGNDTEKPSEEQEIILHAAKESQPEEIQQKPTGEAQESIVAKEQEQSEEQEQNQAQILEQSQDVKQPQETEQAESSETIEAEPKEQESNQTDPVMNNIQSMLGDYPLPNDQVTNMTPITPNTQE